MAPSNGGLRPCMVCIFLGFPSCAGLTDILDSHCYIHFRGTGSTPGLSDGSHRLCCIATFAAVHNCTAVVPFFSESANKRHAVFPSLSPSGRQQAQRENVSWARYLDLQSNPDINGSRAILEASWPHELMMQECRCLSAGGLHRKKEPPCPGRMRCPGLLGKDWRWRSYESHDGLKQLVRQLHLDMRKAPRERRVYSYGGPMSFYRVRGKALGSMGVQDFLMAANRAAVQQGLSRRRDLLGNISIVNAKIRELVRDLARKAAPLRDTSVGRLHPCGMGVSAELRSYAEAQVAEALGGVPFAHLRLRRGDQVRFYPKCSTPANVVRGFLLKMRQARPSPKPLALLIHSNEADPAYWQALLEGFKDSFPRVVTERQLPNPHREDNYFAYAATPVFAELAVFAVHFHKRTVLLDAHRQEMCPEGP